MAVSQQAAPDLAQVKQRQQQMWASGDFHPVAALIQPVAEAARGGARPAGRLARPRRRHRQRQRRDRGGAARREAVGVDYVPALLERGRRRVEAEGADVDLRRGRRRGAPVRRRRASTRSSSVFGAMFAPDHEQAAAELARVVPPRRHDRARDLDARRLHRRDAPDGRAATCRPPAGVASPLLWGTEAYLRDAVRRRDRRRSRCREQTFTFRFRSAEAFVDFFRAYYGPTFKAFEAVGPERRAGAPRRPGRARRRVTGRSDGPVAIPATWLETVAVRTR